MKYNECGGYRYYNINPTRDSPELEINIASNTLIRPPNLQQRFLLVHVGGEEVRVRARVKDAIKRDRTRLLGRMNVPYKPMPLSSLNLIEINGVQMLGAAVDTVQRYGVGISELRFGKDVRGESLIVVPVYPDGAVHLCGLGCIEVDAAAWRKEAVEGYFRCRLNLRERGSGVRSCGDGGGGGREEDGLGDDGEDLGAGDFVEEGNDGGDAEGAGDGPGCGVCEARLPGGDVTVGCAALSIEGFWLALWIRL